MLDGNCSFTSLNGAEFDIWWGAYLGMSEQILLSGPLDEVGEDIISRRAAARHDHGWIMDTYLLKGAAQPEQRERTAHLFSEKTCSVFAHTADRVVSAV